MTTTTTTTESEGIQRGESPSARTRKAEEDNIGDESQEVEQPLEFVDSDRDATTDDDEGGRAESGAESRRRGGPLHSFRGNGAMARQEHPNHHHNRRHEITQSDPLPPPPLLLRQPSTDRRRPLDRGPGAATGASSSTPRLRLRRRRRRRRTSGSLWAGNVRRDLASSANGTVTTGQQDTNPGYITSNGTYHNNSTFSNGTTTLAPSSAPTTSTDAAAMNYQDRVRVALLSLYVAVLVLCFALPVLYYAKLRLGWGMTGSSNGNDNNGRRSQRRRRRRNGSVEDDDDDGDNEDPEDGDRLRRAIERSQVETSETRAFRRKYVEERRARIVQLLAPVQMVLSQDNFAAPATLGSSPFMASATNPPSSAERKVGKGDDADDDDDDDDDDACRVRVPVPGVMVGSRHRAALLLFQGSTGSTGSESGGSLHGSARSLSGGGDESAKSLSLTPPPPSGSQLLYESRWVSGVCSICLCPYQPGDSVCWSSNPQCDHCFHASCIEPWLLKQRDGPLCPICRRDFLIDPYDVVDDDAVSSTPTAAVAAADGGGVSETAVGSDVDVDVEGTATASADATSNRNGGDGSNNNNNNNNNNTNNVGSAAIATESNRAGRPRAFGLTWF